MAKPVYVPQLGRVIQFSDDASDAQIVAEIKSMLPAGPAATAAPAGPDESTLLGRAAYGFATGFTEIPGGLAALVLPAEKAAASPLGQISEQSRKYLQETFGIDPTKDPTAAQQAAEALGSVGSFLVPATGVAKVASLAGRGARIAGGIADIAAAERAAVLASRAGTATAAAQGVALGAGQRAETIRGQLASGMEISPETQLASQQLSGLIGASEALPLERFFGPLTQLLSKVPASKAPVVEKIVKSRLAKVTKAGLAEGAQEAASGIANDIMEYGVYNPDVQIGQDLLSNAGTGAFAGSFVEGLVQLAAGRRLRPYRQLQKDLAAEKQQNAIDARRGIISTAAEQLRQYNVDGPVEVIQDEVENVPIFSLKTRAGNIIGEFADRNAVTEALDIYKAKTGAKVDIIEPESVVSVFPVKINRKQYGSLDEVKADRDGLISKIETMKTTIADPMFVDVGARQSNVSPEFFKKKAQVEVDKLVRQVEPLEAFVFEAERPKPPEGIGTLGTRQAEFAVGPAAVAPKVATPEVAKPETVAAPEVAIPEVIPAPTLETPPEAITDIPEAVSVEPVSPIGMAEEAAVEAPEAVIEAPEAPSTVGSVPFMMTNKIRSGLRDRGYTEEQIFNMRPEEAQDILGRPPEAPPEQLSAGPLPEVAPTPKTVSQVTAEVTAPRDYTPEQKAFDERVFTGLKSRLSTLNLPGIEPVLREMIDKKPGYLVRGFVDAKGTPNDMKIILELSKGILDPRLTVEQNIEALTEVMNHEIIHVVRRMGLFRPAEWNILSKAVKNTKVPGKSYTYLDKAQAVYEPMGGVYTKPEAVVEEAVAEMYKDWVSGKSKPVQNTTGLFNRLREFFRRIFGVLKSNAQEQVFKRIEAGEVGGREAAPIESSERLSASPLPAATQRGAEIDVGDFPEGNIGSSSVYLRKERAPLAARGKIKIEELGKSFDRAFVKRFGRQYDITNPSDYNHMLSSIVEEVKHQMDQAQSGVGWYDADIQDVFAELSSSFPVMKDPARGEPYRRLFTVIAGIMSNGMKAKANVELAAVNFANFLNTGVFSPDNPFTKTGWNQRSNIMGPQIAMLNSMMMDKRFSPRDGSVDPETERIDNFLRFMFSEHSVKDINNFRAQHGTKSPAKIGGVNDKRLGMYSFGPKFGPFILNLNGLTDETVDSWASRSFYRHMGRSIGASGEMNDAPTGPAHREAMKRALRDIAALTNLSSRDVQAVLWFYEKELYNQLGQKVPLEVFSDGAREFTRKYGAGTEGSAQPRADREREISRAVSSSRARFSETGQGVKDTPIRFSAAPLPANLEAMNEKLYAPAPKKSFKDMVFDFFLSEAPTERVFKSPVYGDVRIGKWTRAGLIGRAAVVDKNAIIGHIEKMESEIKGKGFDFETADYSSLASLEMHDRSSHLGVDLAYKGIMQVEKDPSGDILSATLKTVESPDNLANVFSVMLEPGQIDPATGQQEDKRKIWRLYATAKRAIGLKAEGKRVPAELTDAAVKETISFTEANYPEVVEAYKMYQRFNRRLLETAVAAEVISQQELADLTKRMDYYSYYYEVFEEVKGPNISTKTASRFNLRPYKGTELGGLVNDPMYVMLTNMNFWVSAITKNIATRKSFELAKRMGIARALGTGEDPDRTRGEEDQVMFYRDKGVERRFAVSDPLLVTALGSDDRVNVGRFWELMGLPTGWLRESITRDPGFMVANLMRDTVAAWITSGADILPFIGTVKGFASAYKNGASFQALQSRGIVGSYDRAMLGPRELAARIRRDKMPKNIHMVTSPQALAAVTATLWNRLGALSEMSDAATRIAVFDAARAKGLSEAEASWQALRIMNFSRHGASQTLSILTKLVPFLNARIQGLDVLYQAGQAGVRVAIGKARSEGEANLGKKFMIRGGMLAAISMALEMLNDDDEDYQQIEDYVKNANLLIPLSGFGLKGEFVAIPKAFEAGLLFSTFPQQFYKSMTGEASTRENVALFTSSFASTFGVNPIPQFMLPALEVIVNHDFYTGLPLISEGQARLAPELQYNARTSQLAMMISGVPIFYNTTTGRFEGASPIVIDNLIGGYTGPFGTYISQAVSLAMEGVDIGPDRLPRSVSQFPVVRRFFIDTESRNPKVVSQAYELFRVVDEANRSFSRLKQIGDAEAVKDYLDENRDVLSYRKYVFRLVEGLNKLAARERQIAADQDMTREEKFEAMRKLRETRLNLASKVSEINEKIGR